MPYLVRATDSDFRAIGREECGTIEEAEAWREQMPPGAIVTIVEVCDAGNPVSNTGEDLTQS
ncbi:hypothetical protein [Novosphingobium sp. UBA1939]|uniref:hypothetical protein n=1 Tax=Novosphingobium sp. UBA1939 TaxID=1946982 RepID=UPI0025E4B660|nr:hypothetical protein [Novosphingobium sp. UBA1939]